MTGALLGALALVALGAAYHWLRSQVSERDSLLRQPKGWISPHVRLDEALFVADRHLAGARAGANVRLQYGRSGCLTIIRRRPRGGTPGYLARWEFWRPDESLARTLLDLPAERIERPKPDMLELTFGDDYVLFRQAMEQAFSDRAIEEGNTHLTWNC